MREIKVFECNTEEVPLREIKEKTIFVCLDHLKRLGPETWFVCQGIYNEKGLFWDKIEAIKYARLLGES